jgi:hypothetical protein
MRDVDFRLGFSVRCDQASKKQYSPAVYVAASNNGEFASLQLAQCYDQAIEWIKKRLQPCWRNCSDDNAAGSDNCCIHDFGFSRRSRRLWHADGSERRVANSDARKRWSIQRDALLDGEVY